MTAMIRFACGPAQNSGVRRWMAHPVFAWAGLRPVQAQHTEAEHKALLKHGYGRRSVVELGVAEGASAVALREAMDPTGVLYLIDPFHLSRIPALNFMRRAAHRAVSTNGGPRTEWIEKFSHEAVTVWGAPIDFLFIDGDHREAAVEQDWKQWSEFVAPGGIAGFHDARIFPGGWTAEDYGPVRFVNRAFRKGSEPGWEIVEEVDSIVLVRKSEKMSTDSLRR